MHLFMKSKVRASIVFGSMGLLFFLLFILCICIGSVSISPKDAGRAIEEFLLHRPITQKMAYLIVVQVRLPRVVCAALVGAALSLCGAVMQGLFQNPLMDGSTFGVSSGASLGAVVAIALDIQIPGFFMSGTILFAMGFAFVSMLFLLLLAYRIDCSLQTNTLILLGVVFSMFINSVMSFIITFVGEKLKTITFWTMGSLERSDGFCIALLFTSLCVFGGILLRYATELNAFALGVDHARSLGVNVERVKWVSLICVSGLIGICVSISGTIGFVGLMVPHMVRKVVGPNHQKLLPFSIWFGAVFLMIADLLCRVVLRPLELPIGVLTSFVGAIVFFYIFFISRKG